MGLYSLCIGSIWLTVLPWFSPHGSVVHHPLRSHVGGNAQAAGDGLGRMAWILGVLISLHLGCRVVGLDRLGLAANQ